MIESQYKVSEINT